MQVGVDWSTTFTATGGTFPLRWTIAGGKLPPRFVLQPGGELGGTTLTPNTYTFTVKVADKLGQILLDHWDQQGSDVQGDINHDGSVNITDLSMMLSDWTGDSATCD
jgi:hypothetical protein